MTALKHALGLGLVLAACGQAEVSQPQKLPLQPLEIKSGGGVQRLQVEIADDEHEREVGLMFRKQMPDDAGMLFVWPDQEVRSFWMRNTYIPLDLVYVREGKVVKVIPWAKPMDETGLPSGQPVDMVLEVNGGWAAKRGLKVGDTIELK